MGRETKLGMLAGLAFIICFAIILANRGRPLASADYQFPPATGIADPRSTQLGSEKNTTYPPGPAQPDTTQTGNDRDSSMVNPQIHSVSAPQRAGWTPSSGASVVLMEPDRTKTSFDLQEVREDGAGTGVPAPWADQTAKQLELQERLDYLSAKPDVITRSQTGEPDAGTPERLLSTPTRKTTETSRGLKPAARAQSRSHGRREGRRYIVVSGDTLTRIAADHYGKRSSTVVNAIFDANRSAMKNPDDLVVGVELILPMLEVGGRKADLTMTTRPRTSPTTALIRTDRPGADQGFRWYQIEKGEGYSSIAREQLGDSARWQEIFELNQDKFPDPNRIREGVRIKLPAGGSSPAKEKRR